MNRYNLTSKQKDPKIYLGKKYYCLTGGLSVQMMQNPAVKGEVFEIDAIFKDQDSIQLHCAKLNIWDQCYIKDIEKYYEPI